ncbi:uncharacterized protein LOC112576072 [Pomacea canaliculata]|uniref:uncharacterized protein LOC112576072 n=1 Tax=Pomacea canaliculata TaxID=400727 RepID=UPI000D7368B0|nr:uncharacterized protein LOC112576072 [Pomacea canaliculata]
MTTTHQLMAAAFCLCGLFFLLHVDCVNSLSCVNCTFSQPVCDNGRSAPSIVCPEGYGYCTTITLSALDLPGEGRRRGCGTKLYIGTQCQEVVISGYRYTHCVQTCTSNNCNVDVNGTSVIG